MNITTTTSTRRMIIIDEDEENGNEYYDYANANDDDDRSENSMNDDEFELIFEEEGDDDNTMNTTTSHTNVSRDVSIVSNDDHYDNNVNDDDDDDNNNEGSPLNLHPIIEKEQWDVLDECLNVLQNPEYYIDTEYVIHTALVVRTNSIGESVLHLATAYKVPMYLTMKILDIIDSVTKTNNTTSNKDKNSSSSSISIEEYFFVADRENGMTPLHYACANIDATCVTPTVEDNDDEDDLEVSQHSNNDTTMKDTSNHQKDSDDDDDDEYHPEFDKNNNRKPRKSTDVEKSYQQQNSGIPNFTIIKRLLALTGYRALEIMDNKGNTPLHFLLGTTDCFRMDSCTTIDRTPTENITIEMTLEEIISSVLQPAVHQKSIVCSIQNNNGATILHCAIGNHCYERIIMKLVSSYPESCIIEDQYGMIPLHYVAAAVGQYPYTLVAELLRYYPSSIYCQTHTTGDTPLHLVLAHARTYLQNKHEQQKQKQVNTIQPYHPLLQTSHYYIDRNTTKVTELLLVGLLSSSDTSTITSTDSIATNDSTTVATIRRTTSEDSDVSVSSSSSAKGKRIVSPLGIQNYQSYTPLHYCSVYDTPSQLVRIVMEMIRTQSTKPLSNKEWMEILSLQDRNGCTALHLLMSSKKLHESIENVQLLAGLMKIKIKGRTKEISSSTKVGAKVSNTICAIPNKDGYIPLHVAIQNPVCTGTIVKILLKGFPDSIYRKAMDETDGLLLPIHLALRSANTISAATKIQKSVIKELIKAYPSCLKETSTNGNTPLHYAAKFGSSKTIVEMIMDRYPEALWITNDAGEIPMDMAKQSTCRSASSNDKIIQLLYTNASTLVVNRGSGKNRGKGLSSSNHKNVITDLPKRMVEPLSDEHQHPPAQIELVHRHTEQSRLVPSNLMETKLVVPDDETDQAKLCTATNLPSKSMATTSSSSPNPKKLRIFGINRSSVKLVVPKLTNRNKKRNTGSVPDEPKDRWI